MLAKKVATTIKLLMNIMMVMVALTKKTVSVYISTVLEIPTVMLRHLFTNAFNNALYPMS